LTRPDQPVHVVRCRLTSRFLILPAAICRRTRCSEANRGKHTERRSAPLPGRCPAFSEGRARSWHHELRSGAPAAHRQLPESSPGWRGDWNPEVKPTADEISQVPRVQSLARIKSSIRALPAIGWRCWQINCPATSPGIRMIGTDSSGRFCSRLSAIAADKQPVTVNPPSRVAVSALIPTASLPLGLYFRVQVASPALFGLTNHLPGVAWSNRRSCSPRHWSGQCP